jgi:delta 1-pyrroline-5-carboxylate dehydrogenase
MSDEVKELIEAAKAALSHYNACPAEHRLASAITAAERAEAPAPQPVERPVDIDDIVAAGFNSERHDSYQLQRYEHARYILSLEARLQAVERIRELAVELSAAILAADAAGFIQALRREAGKG